MCNERGRVKTLLERLRPELVKTGWMPPELQEPDPHQFINLGPGARRRGRTVLCLGTAGAAGGQKIFCVHARLYMPSTGLMLLFRLRGRP